MTAALSLAPVPPMSSGPRPPAPPEDDGAAAALAPMVEVWFQMLTDHVPDENLFCAACTHGGTGTRATPWPCSLRTIADGARRRHARVVARIPAQRSSPDAPRAARAPRHRRLRGAHGIPRVLTPREQEYLQMAADGRSDSSIAEQLGLPEHTVGSSIRRLVRCLGVHDRATLLILALREGVIS